MTKQACGRQLADPGDIVIALPQPKQQVNSAGYGFVSPHRMPAPSYAARVTAGGGSTRHATFQQSINFPSVSHSRNSELAEKKSLDENRIICTLGALPQQLKPHVQHPRRITGEPSTGLVCCFSCPSLSSAFYLSFGIVARGPLSKTFSLLGNSVL
ncbi:hypothetical protein RRG08_048268 [Elysia crispata]|uniref:Uncharacterized protein n=1 Tax=Elysia crispata TaxID=231223 RepID=A0AAE0ZT01_9GAST|nr:hypothetical protein RRG08_048268 [Elysia crispata]